MSLAERATGEVLVDVEHVSKRFCRDLRTSLVHGAKDIAGELLGRGVPDRRQLRSGEFWALDDVSFQLRRGECLGLIGPNGAGKSTLLKLISGLIKPDAGRIKVRGRVGALIELGAGFHPLLTGRENIRVNASILGLSQRQLADRQEQIIDFADIGAAIDAPVQSYSSGMRARLGFAIAAHLDPDVLLIDEVLAVGDVGFRVKCYDKMQSSLASGLSAMYVSHDVNTVTRMAATSLLLDKGRIESKGVTQLILNRHDSIMAQRLRPQKQHEEEAADINLVSSNAIVEVHPQTSDCPSEQYDVILSFRFESTADTGALALLLRVNSLRFGPLTSFTSDGDHIPVAPRKGGFECTVHLRDVALLGGVYTVDLDVFSDRYDKLFLQKTAVVSFAINGRPIHPKRNFYTVHIDRDWTTTTHLALHSTTAR